MLFRIDPTRIIRCHFATLRDYDQFAEDVDCDQWPDRNGWVVFFALPLIVGGVLVLAGLRLTASQLEVLQGALVVLAGLMLNVLVLLFNAARDRELNGRALMTIRQTYHNIAYFVLTALLFVAVTFAAQLFAGLIRENLLRDVVLPFGTVIAFSSLIHFLFCFFMIMKRVHRLLGDTLVAD